MNFNRFLEMDAPVSDALGGGGWRYSAPVLIAYRYPSAELGPKSTGGQEVVVFHRYTQLPWRRHKQLCLGLVTMCGMRHAGSAVPTCSSAVLSDRQRKFAASNPTVFAPPLLLWLPKEDIARSLDSAQAVRAQYPEWHLGVRPLKD